MAQDEEADRLRAEVESVPLERLPALAAEIFEALALRRPEFAEGEALARRLAHSAETPGGDDLVDLVWASFLLLTGDAEAAEGVFAQYGARRASLEARTDAKVALAYATHGRPEDSLRWLQRAASFAFGVPDGDPAVLVVAQIADTLAERCEASDANGSADQNLLRAAAHFGRVGWERAGTWRDVLRAELRLASAVPAMGAVGATPGAAGVVVVSAGLRAWPVRADSFPEKTKRRRSPATVVTPRSTTSPSARCPRRRWVSTSARSCGSTPWAWSQGTGPFPRGWPLVRCSRMA